MPKTVRLPDNGSRNSLVREQDLEILAEVGDKIADATETDNVFERLVDIAEIKDPHKVKFDEKFRYTGSVASKVGSSFSPLID